MMKYCNLFLIAGILLLASCQKELDPIEETVTPVDSVVNLKKFVVVDPGQVAPADTILKYDFSFDNANRCTQIITQDLQNNETYTTTNYYNNNDTLIAKRRIIFLPANDTAWEYFTYSANGQMATDSVVESNGLGGYNSLTYTYQANTNSITSFINSNSQPFIKGTYVLNKDIRGNILNEKDTASNYQQGGGYLYASSTDNTISYDTHPSPFTRIYPRRIVEADFENALAGDVPLYFAIPQSNNILDETRTVAPSTSGLISWNNRYTYQYNANGYPANVICQDLLAGSTLKGFYFY
jgi:hypothetical protein